MNEVKLITAKEAKKITQVCENTSTYLDEHEFFRRHPSAPDYLFACIEDMAKTGEFVLPIRIPKQIMTEGFESGIRAWSCFLDKLGYRVYREEPTNEDVVIINVDWSEPNDVK